MLKNYLLIAWRSLMRHKGYTLLNITGLSVGLACCILILLFVQYEFSHDRFHEDVHRIYRVVANTEWRGQSYQSASMAKELGPSLDSTFAEVQAVTRIYADRQRTKTLKLNDAFIEVETRYAEPSLFEVFSFSLAQGHAATALQRPHTAVVTPQLAEKLFGDASALGQSLFIDVRGEKRLVEITGVLQPIPTNSHLTFDLLLSLASLEGTNARFSWTRGRSFRTYLLLSNGVQADQLASQLPALAMEKLGAEWMEERRFQYVLEPLGAIYLSGEGVMQYIYIFSAIALLVLLVACANYMNLATARALRRSHEVGVRKVLGAGRMQLARQFWGESMLFVVLAFLVALLLVKIFLPSFNAVMQKEVVFDLIENRALLWGLLGLVVTVGLLAGSYPALVLSTFNPVAVLRSGFRMKRRTARIRKGLILFQFAIATVLILGALVVQKQLGYMQRDLGYEAEEALLISLPDRSLYSQAAVFKAALIQHPAIRQVTTLQGPLVGNIGSFNWEVPLDDGQTIVMKAVGIDYDFLETMKIRLVAGNMFSAQQTAEGTETLILNETAVRQLGWSVEDAVGRRLNNLQEIIGVVEDFHFHRKHIEILGVALYIKLDAADTIVARLHPDMKDTILPDLEAQWKAFAPDYPFSFFFLEDGIAQLYHDERRIGQLVGAFSFLAIFIACLGLFGLAAFMAERRTREIGIRKVLGASVSSIILLLSKDFLRLVLAAILIGTPVAYVLMNQWLDDFAYRIEIGPDLLVMVGLSAILIAFLTVSYQSIKAALRNPVEALRYD